MRQQVTYGIGKARIVKGVMAKTTNGRIRALPMERAVRMCIEGDKK